MDILASVFEVVLDHLKTSGLQLGGFLGIFYLCMQNATLRGATIKIGNAILRVLFSRITSFALKVTNKGSLLNELLLSIQSAIINNDKEKVDEIKDEVKDIKKSSEIPIYQKPSMFTYIRRPLDVMITSKKLILRRNLFRNIARRRKLRRIQSK